MNQIVLLTFGAFGALIMGSAIYWLSNFSDQPKQTPPSNRPAELSQEAGHALSQ